MILKLAIDIVYLVAISVEIVMILTKIILITNGNEKQRTPFLYIIHVQEIPGAPAGSAKP
ncbi:CheW protein [Prevotella dentalis DSM 3688]|uniref:CheW protein n=1 Tax=Prevotella dentalis (strain ATCC 49559 / DSM 3688 / JCM 13448 / NCTC 12043 / ES 2772) TaxID=908937 RepID=F9D245_PREDD|nr:CheW protein [Prevotella dentalis DSM 3688]